MQQLFTPSYKVLIYIEQGLIESQLELYRRLDVSVLACVIFAQFLILIIAWPKFLRNMNEQIWKSRGILTLIPSRLIITNKEIKSIIKNNKLLNQ